jgi:quinol monooxygenase YgiN
MTTAVKTVAIFTARPDQSAALEEMLLAMLKQSRQEPGNLRWDLWRDRSEPNRFVVDELYVDAAAVASHRETAHYKKYAGVVGDVAERLAVTVDPVDVT